MTAEEKNARRRELDKDPFHHALSRKVANAWREAHKDELNARRRAKYAANKEREHALQKAWRETHKENTKAAWARYAATHRAQLRKRDKARAADPVIAAHKRELRRLREKDPKRANRRRWVKRLYYHTHKHDAKGLRWLINSLWLPKWREVVAAGPERIAKYRKRCAVRTRSYFDRYLHKIGVAIPETGDKIFDTLKELGL